MFDLIHSVRVQSWRVNGVLCYKLLVFSRAGNGRVLHPFHHSQGDATMVYPVPAAYQTLDRSISSECSSVWLSTLNTEQHREEVSSG